MSSNPWDGLEPADAYFLGWTSGRGARFGLDYERDDAWDALRDERDAYRRRVVAFEEEAAG